MDRNVILKRSLIRSSPVIFILMLALVFSVQPVQASMLTVTYENLAPVDGIYNSPLLLGFHNGSVDQFDPGTAASLAIEELAENGNVNPLLAEYASTDPTSVTALLTGPAGINVIPVFDPGEVNSIMVDVDGSVNPYFNFASMIVPSNDAFIGNDSPIEIFNPDGSFKGKQIITILGMHIWDAGTEENNEQGAAFINQTDVNPGTDTIGGVIRMHEGYIDSLGNPGGDAIILGGSNGLGAYFDPAGADFTLPYSVIGRITIVPEPMTLLLLGSGVIPLLRRRKRFAS